MQPDCVAVVLPEVGLPDPERDTDPVAVEVPDRLAALAADLAGVHVPERLQELPVEGQAAFQRGHDDVDVVYPPRHHPV